MNNLLGQQIPSGPQKTPASSSHQSAPENGQALTPNTALNTVANNPNALPDSPPDSPPTMPLASGSDSPASSLAAPSSNTVTTAASADNKNQEIKNQQVSETMAALRWLRAGLSEETLHLELPPDVRSSVSPIVLALRWGTLLYGMVAASSKASTGDIWVVVSLSVALFLTVWRTFRPLRLAWEGRLDRAQPIIDASIIGLAVGLSGGFSNPFIFVLIITVAICAFGWGLLAGVVGTSASLLFMLLGAIATAGPIGLGDLPGIALLVVLISSAFLLSFIRDALIARQKEQAAMTNRLDMLSETNEMLSVLNQVARTLPESMDMSEAVHATERELISQFEADTIGLVVRDDATSRWLPMITTNCDFNDSTETYDLPQPLQIAFSSSQTITEKSTSGESLNPQAQSGMYSPLVTRGKVIGLLAVESRRSEAYDYHEVRILDGLASALALTIDNVRAFGRLRTMGADQERTRIARDLHDRLGQWLTYISLELERIMWESPDNESLKSLYGDVQTAIDELRETLRQLRTKVSESETLAEIGPKWAERFTGRTNVECTFTASNPEESLLVRVENELLRIMQEALNNVEKHSRADRVEIIWDAHDGAGVLTISDNGKGFDTSGAVRDTSYGLMGMRERADVIGAQLRIESAKGQGTTVTVHATNEMGL